MVVCTGLAVATVVTGGGAAVAGAIVGAGSGTTAAGGGIGLATATAVGTSGGAIAGAGTASSVAGAAIGAAAGGTSAVGVGGSGLGAAALTAGTGGLGLLAIGTDVSPGTSQVTYDCWKPVVHDTSDAPSKGMLLRDLARHPNVTRVTVTQDDTSSLPDVVVQNIWNERFAIEYLLMHDTGTLVGHARAC